MNLINTLLTNKDILKQSNVLLWENKEILAALDEHENIITVGEAWAYIEETGIMAADDFIAETSPDNHTVTTIGREKQKIEVLYLLPADLKPKEYDRISEIKDHALPLPPSCHVEQILCRDNLFTIFPGTGNPPFCAAYDILCEQLSPAAHTFYTRGIAVNVLERYYYEFLAERHQLYLKEELSKQKRRERRKRANEQKEKLSIKPMQEKDKDFVMEIDSHVNELQYKNRVYTKTGYILWEGSKRVGLMHYCILWDNLPFLNLIYVIESHRNQKIASRAMNLWEEEMKKQGYKMTLLSTQVNETAQHLYRKLGYIDCGALLMNNTPFEQPMEMFMRKVL